MQDFKEQATIQHVHKSSHNGDVTGRYTEIDGERFYVIENAHQMPPFFMSLVSGSNHWAFVASNGAITAGRHSSNASLFPYYSSDKLLDLSESTGPLTIIQIEIDGRRINWEPFSTGRHANTQFELRRHIYKNKSGTRVVFEEHNLTLNLVFRYDWKTGDRFGFIRSCRLANHSDRDRQIRLLDGLLNVVPAGLDSDFQMRFSNLGNAYKKNELIDDRLGIYYLSSIPSDRAEPSEGLRCTTVWRQGLADAATLLSDRQLNDFVSGQQVTTERDVRGQRGCYLACQPITLAANDSVSWTIVADVEQDHGRIAEFIPLINSNGIELDECLREDVAANQKYVEQLIASADGAQCSGIPQRTDRHWSNVTFNVMRGGVPIEGYRVSHLDWRNHLKTINRDIANTFAAELEASAFGDQETVELRQLIKVADTFDNSDLSRIAREYLPFAFSRRHGDPTRPWNVFAIDTRHDDGSTKLNYQGNWRDIFQNWEALALSYPGYLSSMIYRFVNASTIDGYNPYRVTKEGFDWERLDPKDAWANIGYWGDHQIIYLLKLIEWAQATQTKNSEFNLVSELDQRDCVFANVPYRISAYERMLADPRNTIEYDFELADKIQDQVENIGSDGKLLRDSQGKIVRASLFEKLLLTGLVKAANLIPGAGLWLNTQRPEWNDANNALVGIGASVVTACYLRRYFANLSEWIGAMNQTFQVDSDLLSLAKSVESTLAVVVSQNSAGDGHRKSVDRLQSAATEYRSSVYSTNRSASLGEMSSDQFVQLAEVIVAALDQTINANQRNDHLFHAYNLVKFGNDTISVEHLDEMLEGQVAVLSADMLTSDQVVKLLASLWSSRLYRADQDSFLLYPDRNLLRFQEKNQISQSSVANCPLVESLLKSNQRGILLRDANDHLRFAGHLRNSAELRSELDQLGSSCPELASLIEQHGSSLCQVFESTFEHHRFTGRSGTFFGYEGLGSIYWHMVSKLGVAILENYRRSLQRGEVQAADHLRSYYRKLQHGIGCEKNPKQYGAFPTDPYSHSPENSGVKQPGMTGQVKEDILTRLSELGITLQEGHLTFEASLIEARETLSQKCTFKTQGINGSSQNLDLEPGQMGLTFCQVPILYSFGDVDRIEVKFLSQDAMLIQGLTLPQDVSQSLFDRRGDIESIMVRFEHVPE